MATTEATSTVRAHGALAEGRWPDRALAVSVGASALFALHWLLANGAGLTQDDGFYYFRIARHLAAGQGSTFDGLHPTNGYHPLWLLCLAAVFRLQPDPLRALADGMAVQAVLAAVTAALVYLAARATMGRLAALAAAALWFTFTDAVALAGVEFALQALLFVAAAALWARHARDDPRPAVAAALGIVLALAVLARLDNALLVAPIAGALLLSGDTAGRRRRAAAVCGPTALVLGAGAVVGYAVFGQVLPVSGMVKRSWSAHLLAQDPLFAAGGWPAAKLWQLAWPLRPDGSWPLRLAVVATLVAAALALAARRRELPPPLAHCAARLRPWFPFVAYGVLQYVAYALVYHGQYSYTRWYYVAQPFMAALLLAAAVDWAWQAPPRAARPPLSRAPLRLAAAAACLLVPLATARGLDRLRDEQQELRTSPLRRAAAWAGTHLPADARVGTWNAGTIAYLSGRQVVNLDGLVNTARYFRTDQYDLCAYWDRVGVTHLVDVFDPESSRMTGVTLPVTSYYARCADRLELLWEDGAPGDPGWPKAFRLRPPM